MTDWSGRDYAEVSDLQRAMITDAISARSPSRDEWEPDIGCVDGFLTRAIADLVPAGVLVGADASPRMISAAKKSVAMRVCQSPPWVTWFTDEVIAYEPIVGRPGLFRVPQMRVELVG